MAKDNSQADPNAPAGAVDALSTGLPVLTGPQIRLRIANVLLGQGVKMRTQHLRDRVDEIHRVVNAKGADRAQLRFEIVELAARRSVDVTSGDLVIDMINELDAVVYGEPVPPTQEEIRAAKAEKAGRR